MNDHDSNIIEDLRSQVSSLESRVHELERRTAPVAQALPPPVVQPQTVVSYPQPRVTMPSSENLKSLAAIVLNRFPELSPPADNQEAQWRWDRVRERISCRREFLDV